MTPEQTHKETDADVETIPFDLHITTISQLIKSKNQQIKDAEDKILYDFAEYLKSYMQEDGAMINHALKKYLQERK